ncbi:hypothetical protein E2C01_025823 [Portunus trituberculatus]|uniref:Uncharacterized protein n=1 Tax=Portunus trituberculatus TaxID=210409 RepID=A0A5B7EEA2_PORTR|nr:hypothetical protein [Portunus trituberculatus]
MNIRLELIRVPATSKVGGASDDVSWLEPTSLHCSLPHQASVHLKRFYREGFCYTAPEFLYLLLAR